MMRRISMLAVLGLVAVAACVQEPVPAEPENQTIAALTFTATTEPATKTALSGNDEQGYVVNWQSGDQIWIYGVDGTRGVFTTESTTASGSFTFTSGTSGDPNYALDPTYLANYRAYYPATLPQNNSYMSLLLPATQQYVAGNVAQAPMYAFSQNTNLDFKNLCGIIRLNLSTTQSDVTVSKIILTADQGMSGSFEVKNDAADVYASVKSGVTLDCGSGVAIGSEPTPFYLSVPPKEYTNLRIKVVTTDGARQSKVANKTISVSRSKITPINLSFNDFSAEAIDLSATETANSYLVSVADSYKFRATIKGNGEQAPNSSISPFTSDIASAVVLWKTYGRDVYNGGAPGDNDLIRNVRYSNDGYVYFETGEEFKEGNALVAVRDASQNILWSWHIWFESDNLAQLAQTYPGSGAVMMDRNLGATTNLYSEYNFLDAGLLYEWGRKDPFPNKARAWVNGGGTFLDNQIWGQAIGISAMDVAGSIAHPTDVSTGGIDGATWDSDNKILFDPCPPGWKVPAPAVFSGVTNTATWTSGQGGTINLGSATAWFPAAGTYGHGHLQHFYQGEGAYMYTTTSSYSKSFDITSSIHGSMQAKDSYWACSVRCVRDNDSGTSGIDISVYQDLSTGGTANCYQVQGMGSGASFGKYKFPATVKGNGAADLAGISKDTDPNSIYTAELLWASYGTATAPAADALIKQVFYKDGYVCFTVNANGSRIYEGNAVIAIRDYFGNILWSWHIWLEEDAMTDPYEQNYTGGGTFMNRNLGANSSDSKSEGTSADYGLLYQWGRKDPFLSAPDRTTYGAAEPGVYGATRTAKNQLYTMAEAIQHPTDFPFTFNNTPWMVEGEKNIAFWDDSKTIFDPCPPGWKVPSKASWGTTFVSYFNEQSANDSVDGVRVYTGSVQAWFPSVAYRQGAPTKNGNNVYIQGQGILQHRGDNPYIRIWCSNGILWRDVLNPVSGSNFGGGRFAGLYDLDQDLLVSPWFYYGTYRDNACSVRCVKE